MIEIIDEQEKLNKDIRSGIEQVYSAISSFLMIPDGVKVTLTIESEEDIRNLNKISRNKDTITDVLTFPYVDLIVGERLNIADYKQNVDPSDNTLLIGDIHICFERAVSQANEYGHSLLREICFLFLHGMLHVFGYDHETQDDASAMEGIQQNVLNKLGITRDIKFKCGFVTIVGDTNVGKSTLINTLVGEHVAIVSPKTQTTRENIKGIYNDSGCQIVFVDTPGFHKRSVKIDDIMDSNIKEATEDTEIILMMISAKKPLVRQFEELSKRIPKNTKRILLINKVDESSYEILYPQLSELGIVAQVDEILPLSAKNGTNREVLIEIIKKYLPTYDFEMRYYPIDEYTDKNLRHIVSEIIREKALYIYDDEIPHGIAVQITEYKEGEDKTVIMADVCVEKDSHKAIVLGKNGEKIKELGIKSRQSIEKLLMQHVNLELYVKVKPNWRNNMTNIAELGLTCRE